MSGVELLREVLDQQEPDKYEEARKFLIEGVLSDDPTSSDEIERQPGERIVVAENESGEIIAAGSLDVFDHEEYSLTFVCTAETHRKRGLGTKIVGMLERLAREAGASSMEVTAASDASAVFFQRRGYDTSTKRNSQGYVRSEYIKSLA